MDSLARVKRAAGRRASAEKAWKDSVRAAYIDNKPIRAIGKAAGVSHVHVLRIVRSE